MSKNTIIVVALLGFMVIFSSIATAQNKNAKDYPDFSILVERLLPTVVNISTTGSVEDGLAITEDFVMPHRFFEGLGPFSDLFREFDPNQRRGNREKKDTPPSRRKRDVSSLGSGFVIDAKNGYIITNKHVIENSEEITVTLNDNSKISAEIVGSDEKTDIAVIKLKEAKNLSAIKWGDSDKLPIGAWVLAIGNPFGLGGTVTKGIVSARNRDINAGPYDDFIQTDAAINKGNSGGPLFNTNGEVVGINTAIFSTFGGGSIGIGFAIPANMAKNVAEQIIKYGSPKRGWLGVKIQHITDEMAESLGLDKTIGALVTTVTEKGPADKAGIQQGDIIIEFDGQTVEKMRSLPKMVAGTEIGKEVPVKIMRMGQEMPLTAKISVFENNDNDEENKLSKNKKSSNQDSDFNIDKLGIFTSELTDDLVIRYGLDKKAQGLLITKTDPRGTAFAKGLRIGDLVRSANQLPTHFPDDLNKAIEYAEKQGRNSILLFVDRRGNEHFIAVPIKK